MGRTFRTLFLCIYCLLPLVFSPCISQEIFIIPQCWAQGLPHLGISGSSDAELLSPFLANAELTALTGLHFQTCPRSQRLKPAEHSNMGTFFLPAYHYFLSLWQLFVFFSWFTLEWQLAEWQNVPGYFNSISTKFFLPPAPLLSFPSSSLSLSFLSSKVCVCRISPPSPRGTILAAWVYDYCKEESLKGKVRDVIPQAL